jgi:hypothetical protein
MAELIAVVGPSGSGKTRSLLGLNSEETMLVSITGKKIPMKGFSKKYKGLSPDAKAGNYYQTKDYAKLIKMLKFIDSSRPDIKNIVLDDYNYIGAFEYFKRASEAGFGKFAEIGQHIANPLIEASTLRDNLKIFVLNHDEMITEDFKPLRKMKTIGKLVDNCLTMEGLFTIVLFTEIRIDKDDKREYGFITNSNGSTTAKSPEGMFEDYIPNDLGAVVTSIDEYYGE